MTLILMVVLLGFHLFFRYVSFHGYQTFPWWGEGIALVAMLVWQLGVLWRKPRNYPALKSDERAITIQAAQSSIQAGITASTIVLTIGITAMGFVYTTEKPIPPLVFQHFQTALGWAAVSTMAGAWNLFSIPTQALTLDIRTSKSVAGWSLLQFNTLMISAVRMLMGVLVLR